MVTTPRPKIDIRLGYYTTSERLFQTIVYGQIVGRPRKYPSQSDFHFAIIDDRVQQHGFGGKDIFNALGATLKRKVVSESKKRIAVVSKQVSAGKYAGRGYEDFVI